MFVETGFSRPFAFLWPEIPRWFPNRAHLSWTTVSMRRTSWRTCESSTKWVANLCRRSHRVSHRTWRLPSICTTPESTTGGCTTTNAGESTVVQNLQLGSVCVCVCVNCCQLVSVTRGHFCKNLTHPPPERVEPAPFQNQLGPGEFLFCEEQSSCDAGCQTSWSRIWVLTRPVNYDPAFSLMSLRFLTR